jgi:transcriptional regulator with XRE-family HTH domain
MDESQLLQNFGDRVRALRLDLGVSQEKLALDCGLDRTYISGIERGKRNVSLVNIHRLADALGVPASDLLKKGGGK